MEDPQKIRAREMAAWAIRHAEEVVRRFPALADPNHPGWGSAYIDQHGLHFPGAGAA